MALIGDIFSIPLSNGSFAIGQICTKRNAGLSLIVVADGIYKGNEIPSPPELPKLLKKLVIVVDSFDSAIDRREWVLLMNAPPVLSGSKLPAYSYPLSLPWNLTLIAKSYDGKRLRLAWPWEIVKMNTCYTVSISLLQKIASSYFLNHEKWDPRYNRVLFKNYSPFW